MADPPIIQRVELQGAEDAQRLLRQIGETGERAFERLSRAAENADLTRLDADRARQGIEGLGRNIDQLIDRLQRMRDDVRRSGDALSSVTRSAQEIPPALRLVSSASRDASRTTTDGFNEATEAVRGTQQAAEGAAQGLQQTAQTANDAAVRIGLIAGAVAAVTAKVIELGAQGVRSLLSLPTAAQDVAAKIAGQAEKLGTATSSYLRLAEAARQAGVSEEALASGTADLRKVLDSIGQAGDRVAQKIETVGGGFTIIQRGSAKVEIADKRLHNLATALAGVGLNFAQVSNAGTRMEDVLGIIAGKLAVLDEVSARTKLQALGKALGKDAATVIPVIQNLVEAQKRYNSIVSESSENTEGWLQSFEKMAERGKAIREVTKGFGTGGIIDRVTEAKKAVDELGAATSALGNRIGALFVQGPSLRVVWATKLADAVTALLFKFERLAEAQKEAFLQNLGDSPAELVFKTLIATSRALASLWNDVLVPAGQKIVEIFKAVADAIGGGVRGSDVAGVFIAATIAVTGLIAALKLLQVAFSPVGTAFSTLSRFAPLLALLAGVAALFWSDIAKAADEAFKDIQKSQDTWKDAFTRLFSGDFAGFWVAFKTAAVESILTIVERLQNADSALGDFARAITGTGKVERTWVKEIVDLLTGLPAAIAAAGLAFLAFRRTLGTVALGLNAIFGTKIRGDTLLLIGVIAQFSGVLQGVAHAAFIAVAAITIVDKAVVLLTAAFRALVFLVGAAATRLIAFAAIGAIIVAGWEPVKALLTSIGLEDFVKLLERVARATREFARGVASIALGDLTTGIEHFKNSFKEMFGLFDHGIVAWGLFAGAALLAISTIRTAWLGLAAVMGAGAAGGAAAAGAGAAAGGSGILGILARLAGALSLVGILFKVINDEGNQTAKKGVDVFSKEMDELNQKLLDGKIDLNQWQEAAAEIKRGTLAPSVRVDDAFKQLDSLQEKAKETDKTVKDIGKSGEAGSSFLETLKKQLNEFRQQLQQLGPAAQKNAGELTGSLAEAATAAKQITIKPTLMTQEQMRQGVDQLLQQFKRLQDNLPPLEPKFKPPKVFQLIDDAEAEKQGAEAGEKATKGFAEKAIEAFRQSRNVLDLRPFEGASELTHQLLDQILAIQDGLAKAGHLEAAGEIGEELNSISAGIREAQTAGLTFGQAMEAAGLRLLMFRNGLAQIPEVQQILEQMFQKVTSGGEQVSSTLEQTGQAAQTFEQKLQELSRLSTLDVQAPATFAQTVVDSINQIVSGIATAITNAFQLLNQSVLTAEAAVIASIDRMVQAIVRAQQQLSQFSQGSQPNGSPAPGFSSGGHFRGRPGKDTNLAWLTDNEYVVRVAAVKKYGVAMLNAINSGRFALGGLARGGFPAFQEGGQFSSDAEGNKEIARQSASNKIIDAAVRVDEFLRQAAESIGRTMRQMGDQVFDIGYSAGEEAGKESIKKKKKFYGGGLVTSGNGNSGSSSSGGLMNLLAGLRGFDGGGLVEGLLAVQAPRMAFGGIQATGSGVATRPLTLVLDGQRFPNLTGPTDVIDNLEKTAVRRRHAAIGPSPSWRK